MFPTKRRIFPRQGWYLEAGAFGRFHRSLRDRPELKEGTPLPTTGQGSFRLPLAEDRIYPDAGDGFLWQHKGEFAADVDAALFA